ncbi:MAG: hypothetical protein KF842_03110 [Caulobacter sp.]|nr:hypothetical protein [Caulobacter sp.]
MKRRAAVLLLTALTGLAASGCGDGKKAVGHQDITAQVIQVDPNPDPAVVRWAGCLETVTRCVEAGGEVGACATPEACEPRCVTALNTALEGVSGREARLDAFETVFIRPGAVCRPVGKPAP